MYTEQLYIIFYIKNSHQRFNYSGNKHEINFESNIFTLTALFISSENSSF